MEEPQVDESYTAESFDHAMSQFRKYLEYAAISYRLQSVDRPIDFDILIGYTRYEGTNYWGVNPIVGQTQKDNGAEEAREANIFETKWRYFDDGSLAYLNSAASDFSTYNSFLENELDNKNVERDINDIVNITDSENWKEGAADDFRSQVANRIESACSLNIVISKTVEESIIAYSSMLHSARSAVYELLRQTLKSLYKIGDEGSGPGIAEAIEVITGIGVSALGSEDNTPKISDLFSGAIEAFKIKIDNGSIDLNIAAESPSTVLADAENELDKIIDLYNSKFEDLQSELKDFNENVINALTNGPVIQDVSGVYG